MFSFECFVENIKHETSLLGFRKYPSEQQNKSFFCNCLPKYFPIEVPKTMRI